MSVSLFWVSGVWFIDFLMDIFDRKDPWRKFRAFWSNKWAVLITSLFALHILGLIHTSDWNYAMRDLRIKVPLLILPFVVSGLPRLTTREFKTLIIAFIIAVFIATLCCVLVYWVVVPREYNDIREITHLFVVNISHIRLSLMSALAIAIAGVMAVQSRKNWVFAPIALFMLYFLWVIESMTGIFAFAAAMALYFFYQGMNHGNQTTKIIQISSALIIVASSIWLVSSAYNDYHQLAKEYDPSTLPEFTPYGERYDHKLDNTQVENGHYVWWYIAWEELENTWAEKSPIGLHDKDANGQELYGTLVRYMSSKGLTKDRDGVNQLTAADIRKIESGVASASAGKRSGLRARLDRIFLEVDLYLDGGNPTGHSLTQRLEFWRAGWYSFKNNWFVGVGTGDVPDTMAASYEAINSRLSPKSRLRSHNQYLTFAIAFGIVGLLWIAYVLLYPVRKGYLKDFHFFLFYAIALISLINEDTLESQAGLSFFTFLLCIISVARTPASEINS